MQSTMLPRKATLYDGKLEIAPVAPFKLICNLALLGNLDALQSCSWGARSGVLVWLSLWKDAKDISILPTSSSAAGWLTHKPVTLDKGHLRVVVVGPSPQSVYIT